MERTIKRSTLNAAIEAACNNLCMNCGFTNEECMAFVSELMESLDNSGWKIIED